MCLRFDNSYIKKSDRQRKRRGFVYRYKVVKGRNTTCKGKLVRLTAIYQHNDYECNNVSDRPIQSLQQDERDYHRIYYGMHTCVTLKRAKYIFDYNGGYGSNIIIIRVKCYHKDLVLLGKNNEAVYTRFYIEPSEYKKALRNLNRRKNVT